MATPSLSSKSCADLEIRLPNNSSIESAQVSASHNSQWLQHTGKASLSRRLRSRYAQKRGYLPSQGMHNSRFLQQIVSCTKTREKMAPSNRLKCTEQLSAGTDIQDGNCRDHPKFAYKREWLVSIDLKDAYFHVPIHPASHHLLRFHVDKRTYQFKALPFGLATAPLEFTRIVQEVKLVLQSR